MVCDRLNTTGQQLAEFCQQRQIAELSVFGSVLRDDFGPNSDIDLLIAYAPTAKRGLLEKMCLKEEFEQLFKRPVDLVSKTAIEQSHNWIRRKNILDSAKTIYVKKSGSLS
ncbi:MAG: nucleotidyltransferase domain-containing protein [Cyanobacteria bacterium P01_F01_bin.150]